MADPLAPTVIERRRADGEPEAEAATERAAEGDVEPGAAAPGVAGPDDASAAPSMMARAPVADPLERAVAKAKAAAALFGDAAAVRVGRYRLIERAGAGGMGVVWSAWDPELNRGVALKLASAGDAAARAWARDEGRALAKLSHPNVVPIYDVFEAPEGVFLVMELVAGRTLRAVASDGATVAELVRAYRQCGEGLAAAHHAGLIHRDFKPDNAILGGDGRVRVLDFGLAHAVDDDDAPLPAGTPRYMAPEQVRGDPLTAAVDQYALCVALREAVAARGPTPSWLEPILARGAAAAPDARFPSMDALVAALALDPRARLRRRLGVGAGVVAVAAIGAAFTLGRRGVGEAPCQTSAGLAATAWGGARRTAANTHLAALRAPYAAESVPRIVGALDRYATDWAAIHKGACLAHRRGEVSSSAYDRRTACLSQRRAALATVGGLAGAATVEGLPGLVNAVGGLPDLALCEDDDALLSPVAPPTPAQAAEAAAVSELIAAADVERDAGDIAAATRDADAALARGGALGYLPLIARARLARARIALATDSGDRGAADFGEVTRDALRVGDDALAVEAYARAAFALATAVEPARATDGLALVEAIATRAGDRGRFPRALLHHNVGAVELARGHRAAAQVELERARAESHGLTGAPAIEMTVVLQSLLLLAEDDAARLELGDALIAARSAALGRNHPDTLIAGVVRAALLSDRERGRVALREPCGALARLHPTYRGYIRECGFELVWRSAVAGDIATMRELARAVIAADEPGVEPDPSVARARAYLLLPDDAAAAVRAFAAIPTPTDDTAWFSRLSGVDTLLGRALAELTAGDRVAGRATLARADAIAAAIESSAPALVAHRRSALAELAARYPP